MNDLIEVFIHNLSFFVADCAFFVHCAFVAEKELEKIRAGERKSEQLD